MSAPLSFAVLLAAWMQAPNEVPEGPAAPPSPEPRLEDSAAPPSPGPRPKDTAAPPSPGPGPDSSTGPSQPMVLSAPVELRPARPRRFVFAFMPALTFGISAWMIPSLNASFFFGGRLRRDRWALGVQATFSAGLAERYYLGINAYRLHFTALHHFGARGFATIGGGVTALIFYPAVVEAETKVGVRLGKRRRALIGGLVRLGINFYYHERAPLPQFGIFTGLSFL